ncbi:MULTISPECIES: fimbrial protein [Providencia]|uniref:fimbrial protein n=1 Tax=Providencia TaxID=586 RepID=UPI001CFD49A9|nr:MULTISPECIES: fimbrial protein [Providencia]EIU7559091.1 fimbrial protein [Providencia rettgeri]MCB4843029.1 fimbrial protein [Providencia rettgeri]MCG5276063.1 fimbrial protein [Providencia rettgeri]MCG9509216.1 fimbrial protein [Providencia rettgeri]
MQPIRWLKRAFALVFLVYLGPASGMGLNLSGNLVVTPPECILNNGQQQAIHFNDILLTRIDGSNYLQPLTFQLTCTQLAKNSIKLTIKGDATSFNSNGALKTSNTKLGVAFYVNDVRQRINESINVNYTALPTIKVAPVKNLTASYSNTDGGVFSALATLKVDYQ